MAIAAKLDELGKPAWIALTILGFMAWWPVGLATLAFAFGSGRMGCGGRERFERKMGRMQDKMERFRNRMDGGFGGGPSSGSGWGGSSWNGKSSGNSAFDEYRTETLKRLEDEQREFQDFLYRLRFAKDKAEFDQFMAERRNQPAPQPPAPQS